jgi:hypothetical protein
VTTVTRVHDRVQGEVLRVNAAFGADVNGTMNMGDNSAIADMKTLSLRFIAFLSQMWAQLTGSVREHPTQSATELHPIRYRFSTPQLDESS